MMTSQAIAPIQLHPCDSCGRKFNLEALQRHIKVKLVTRMVMMKTMTNVIYQINAKLVMSMVMMMIVVHVIIWGSWCWLLITLSPVQRIWKVDHSSLISKMRFLSLSAWISFRFPLQREAMSRWRLSLVIISAATLCCIQDWTKLSRNVKIVRKCQQLKDEKNEMVKVIKNCQKLSNQMSQRSQVLSCYKIKSGSVTRSPIETKNANSGIFVKTSVKVDGNYEWTRKGEILTHSRRADQIWNPTRFNRSWASKQDSQSEITTVLLHFHDIIVRFARRRRVNQGRFLMLCTSFGKRMLR